MTRHQLRPEFLQWALAAALVALIVVARWLPHPPNFAPVMAVALFAAYCLPTARAALAVVLSGMVLSDLLLGTYSVAVMASVYAMTVATLWFGRRAKSDSRPVRWILGGSVVSAVAFFLVTNAAVWAFTPYYSPGLDGLIASWVAGIPFLKWTIAGNVVWTLALFGLPFLLTRPFRRDVAPSR